MHALVMLTAVLSTLSTEPTPTPAPPASPAAAAAATTLQIAEEQRARAEAEQQAAGRFVLETLAGAGIGIAGIGVYGMTVTSTTSPGAESVLIPLGIMALGTGLGVSLVGTAMHREGSFIVSALGGAVGFLVPLLVGVAAISGGECDHVALQDCPAFQLTVAGMLVAPAIGAAIGYEATGKDVAPTPAHASLQPPRRQLVPVVAPASQGLGAIFGIAGTL